MKKYKSSKKKNDQDDNKSLRKLELKNRDEIEKSNLYGYLYPSLDDKLFNSKISQRKEFYDTKYEGKHEGKIEEVSNELCNADFELAPHQTFVRNFLSFQTPYNGLLLYHGLGSGKTCSAISVAEEMRDYMKQMGITQRIIVVASPNVQDNFILQLFDERKLREVDGLWNIRACTGNKYLKEINPMNMKGLTREKVITQIKRIINTSYLFMGYLEFANFISKKADVGSEVSAEKQKTLMKYKLRKIFEKRLIIIDEVHNIRFTEDNKDKRVAVELTRLIENVPNLRLLLLSATPMYNSYKEIAWLLGLLNKNDRRSTFEVKDVFNKDGSFIVSKSGEEIGKDLLIRKATGYVSFVRGENPYIFPFRIWPTEFSPENTFAKKIKPSIQMNGKPIIASSEALNVLSIYLCDIGSVQQIGYDYIIDKLKKGELIQNANPKRIMPSFENMESVGYPLLQRPFEALNMVFPDKRLGVENSNLDPKDIVGKGGLSRIMSSRETVSPQFRGDFEYKTDEFGRIFSPELLGKYSSKIKNICDSVKKSTGVILIYSHYIDAGLLPVALALEEIGLTRAGRESLFKTAPTSPVDAMTFKPKSEVTTGEFTPAKYIMITGTETLSPDNVAELNMVTDPDNKYGQNVKVVLISQAGAEGLDFKFIRQVHILEPWYNMNRPEQVIGRAVRSCSHKALPFSERNVEIYLYGSILNNEREEAADLYLYRLAELKALQIGNVTRALKQSAVDCILNSEQQGFTIDKMNMIVTQNLSSGKSIQYQVGDRPYSSACDYLEKCEYRCTPDKKISDKDVIYDTYGETFITMNNDKIIQNIRRAFKERFYYRKEALVNEINANRNYPLLQINSALEQLVNDSSEYVTDIYDRLGRVVNIGELYLFQPIELENKNISIYDRSVPVAYKRKSLAFENTQNILEPNIKTKKDNLTMAEKILFEMEKDYNSIYSETKDNKPETWSDYCKIAKTTLVDFGYKIDDIDTAIIQHLIESLRYEEIIDLLNYIDKLDVKKNKLLKKIKDYYENIKMLSNGYEGILVQDAGKRVLIVRPDDKSDIWKKGESEDEKDFISSLSTLVSTIIPLGVKTGNMFGFMASFKKQFMVYKFRDINSIGMKGARCDQSKKKDIVESINTLIKEEVYSKNTKVSRTELCVIQELLLRLMNNEMNNNKRWFLTPGEAAAFI